MVPLETLLCSLKDGKRKSPKNFFLTFWPYFSQNSTVCRSERVFFLKAIFINKIHLLNMVSGSQPVQAQQIKKVPY